MDTQQFIEKAISIHNNIYDYNLVEYTKSNNKVKIVCSKHGVFEQRAGDHLKGMGCRKCQFENQSKLKTKTSCEFIEEAKLVHDNKYDYSLVKYINNKTKVKIICPKHGIFEQSPVSHLSGKGCTRCKFENQIKRNTKTTENFIQRANLIHDDKYDYSLVNYTGVFNKVKIVCSKHGVFEQRPNDHLVKKNGCPKCKYIRSNKEIELYNFIKTLNINCTNNANVISPKTLDIYLPNYNLAIEFNGLLHHSELRKPNDYHYNKTKLCNSLGIELIHVWEDDWEFKKEIVKSIIKNKLKITENTIHARKCKIVEINHSVAKEFYNNNHIQSSCNPAQHNIALYVQDNIVSCMSFSNNASNRGAKQWELIRFCNKINYNVVGGANKLFKYFINKYKVNNITSYSNNDYFNGNLYEKLGFKFIKELKPDYKTIYKKRRTSKQFSRKSNLIKLFPNSDINNTEHKICLDNKLYRIYDAGKKKWGYNFV